MNMITSIVSRRSMPEQGGTGVQSMPKLAGTGVRGMPEKDGTGLRGMPEQGGTGIRAGTQFGWLAAVLLSASGVQAADAPWPISGEFEGSAQVVIENDSSVLMSFSGPEGFEQSTFVAAGRIKNGYAALSLFRLDVKTPAQLVAAGAMEVFFRACEADAEIRLLPGENDLGKAESEGTGDKLMSALPASGDYVVTLRSPSAKCLAKAESEGTG